MNAEILTTDTSITTCVWFDTQAEEAAKFYTGIFSNSQIGTITHYGESGAKASGQPLGSVMTVVFQIAGQEFLALNGGPAFKHSHAVSFIVNCDIQEEVDYFWERLSAGGEKSVCGWLVDKFGLSWQITPRIVSETMKGPDKDKTERVMAEVMKMAKIEIEPIRKALGE